MTRVAILIAASLIATAAQAREPYEGTWDEDGRQCLVRLSESRAQFEGKEYTGYEESCKFSRTRKVGSKTTIAMACEGEGETWNKTMTLEATGINRLSITQGKNTRSLIRCPNLSQQATVDALIKLWDQADDTCRGTSGPGSDAACTTRSQLTRNLFDHEWCYGLRTQVSVAMRWHKCTAKSNHPQE